MPLIILLMACASIHTAARKGNTTGVKRWLALGKSPNSRHFFTRDTVLIEASLNGNLDVVKVLVEKGTYEKVLKRMHSIAESGASFSEKERELLSSLLNSPENSFVIDPQGMITKAIFVKAENLIKNNSVSLKDKDKEKRHDHKRCFC